jgi:hypothetical protein
MEGPMLVKKVPISHRMFWILPQEAVLETVDEKLMVLVEEIGFQLGLRAENWKPKVGWKVFVGPLEVLVATLNFASEVA